VTDDTTAPGDGGEYVPDAAADDALCTAADDRAIQYAVPDASDDDLALADSVFVNRVHQAILGSTWMKERLEQAREDEREHIAQRLDAQWRHRSDYDRMTVGRARRTAVRIARERNARG
jgi:hypothetical protein